MSTEKNDFLEWLENSSFFKCHGPMTDEQKLELVKDLIESEKGENEANMTALVKAANILQDRITETILLKEDV